jgi:hypothetical protein
MPSRVVEVLLESPHAHLRRTLQAELGEHFMVCAGGEPEGSEVIIITGPDPERAFMLRQAYPSAGIFVLELSESPTRDALGCLKIGADGLLVGRSEAGLGAHVRALARRLYNLPATREEDLAEGI